MGTIPTPATQTAGAVVTSTLLNGFRDVMNFWASPPQCQAVDTAGPTLTTSTDTIIALASENYDVVQSGDSPMHDNTTNNSRITIRTAGKYQVDAYASFTSNATGSRRVEVFKNGTTVVVSNTSPAVSGASTNMTAGPFTVALAVNDYIELRVWQSSGGNLTLNAGSPGPAKLTARLISA